jgi:hypothetical protein
MIKQRGRQRRDQEVERQERLRYEVLERLYLLTGTSNGGATLGGEVEDQLGLSMGGYASAVADLQRLGYLTCKGAADEFHLTERGLDYMRQGAWRRRSVRN